MPVKSCVRALGKRTFSRSRTRPEPIVRKRFMASSSVEASPWARLTATGKKVYMATTNACDEMPNPNQITTKGAMATIGRVWETTITG